MTHHTATEDSDFRRLVLWNRILSGVRDAAAIAKRLEQDREELLSIAGRETSQEVSRETC